MCVIVYKERGKEIPNSEIIEKCFHKNPDGSGILLHRRGTKLLEIHKGFMKLDDFKTALSELNVTKDDDLVLHFRITTSGGTSPENCHPFPISSNVNELKATRLNTRMGFVHNGILGKGDTELKISDTQLFIRDVISRTEICNHLDNAEVKKIITDLAGTGQRFFIADAEKDIFEKYGTWYEDNGIFYSNLIWKTYTPYINTSYYGNYYHSKGKNYKYSYNDYSYYGGYYQQVNNEAANYPDVNTLLCPYCDKKMVKILEKHTVYMCPDCGTLYDDSTFEIYDKKQGFWLSIADINGFESSLAS